MDVPLYVFCPLIAILRAIFPEEFSSPVLDYSVSESTAFLITVFVGILGYLMYRYDDDRVVNGDNGNDGDDNDDGDGDGDDNDGGGGGGGGNDGDADNDTVSTVTSESEGEKIDSGETGCAADRSDGGAAGGSGGVCSSGRNVVCHIIDGSPGTVIDRFSLGVIQSSEQLARMESTVIEARFPRQSVMIHYVNSSGETLSPHSTSESDFLKNLVKVVFSIKNLD